MRELEEQRRRSVAGITQSTSNVAFAYDDANRRTSLTLPNGIVMEYGYDAASQLTGITYKLGTTTLGDLTYAYDLAGNRTALGGTWARTNLPAAVNSASYDAANQIVQFGGVSFTYDANGNLTNDGTRTYTWNTRNELVALAGPVAESFLYDGFGRRRAKTFNGMTTGFLYDGLNPVQELSGGVPTANVLSGLGIDEFLTRTDAGGARSFLTDALGSTLGLADVAGAVQTEYAYEPFGGFTASGIETSNLVTFTGREVDETGLLYYRARYYDSSVQRFISEDPIGFSSGEWNLHAYAGDSPTRFTDPTGTLRTAIPTPIPCREKKNPILNSLCRVPPFVVPDLIPPGVPLPLPHPPLPEPNPDSGPGSPGDRPSGNAPWGSTPEGRRYTNHYGTETGPDRNIPGSVIDDILNRTEGVPGRDGTTVYYDPINDVTVVTGRNGIVSARRGRP